jgi:hypothetical protein
MLNMNSIEKDFEKWCNCELVSKCHNCDVRGNISQLDRFVCSKICGFITYECDDCESKQEKQVLIEKKLFKIQFNEFTKYKFQKNETETMYIYICNSCQKSDDDGKIIKNIDLLLNSNNDGCKRGPFTYDCIGNQLTPTIIENDLEYNIKTIFN